MIKRSEKIIKIAKILFAIYIAALILVIILKFPTGMVSSAIKYRMDGGNFGRVAPQFVPFKTIISYVSQVQTVSDWFFENLACNIIMFMPYGFLVPMIIKKQKFLCFRVIVSGGFLSILIEIFQYITALGVCDIDDVILNTLGTALGFGIYKIFYVIGQKSTGG